MSDNADNAVAQPPNAGDGTVPTFDIYPLQRDVPDAKMVPLLKGGTLVECLSWYLAEAQQTGEVPIWAVCFISTDAAAKPLVDALMAAADTFAASQQS